MTRSRGAGQNDTGCGRRVAVITGAGAGIGRATALLLAQRGATVVVADLHAPTATQVVAEITASGAETVAIVGDLGDPTVVDHLVTETVATYPGVNVLVNDAGVMDDMSAARSE